MSQQLSSSTTVRLNDGNEMPIFGLGVFRSAAGGEAQQAVGWAIKHGYVHIDTAALYR
jgi:diketogulonate reductase-like aldo/keto reductase